MSGAGPCVILCMRDRISSKTILAHIDAMTENYMNPFLKYDSKNTDVFLIGGDDSTRYVVYDILKKLHDKNFDIKLSHVIDPSSNSFAIDCVTGIVCLNNDKEMTRTQMTNDDIQRYRLSSVSLTIPSELIKINIKDGH